MRGSKLVCCCNSADACAAIDSSTTLSELVRILRHRRLLPSEESIDADVHHFFVGTSSQRARVLDDEPLVARRMGVSSNLFARMRTGGGVGENREGSSAGE